MKNTCRSIIRCQVQLLVAAGLFLFSCERTQDQFVGQWELSHSKIFGEEEVGYTPLFLTFSGDGSFVQVKKVSEGDQVREGQWHFDATEQHLHMLYDHDNNHVLWRLVDIDENMLMMEYTGFGFFVEREFRRKK